MFEAYRNPVFQVLMNDDLLYTILQFSKSQLKGGRADLVRYARVCRAFHGPVVGVLWSELTSITPLWHLLAPPKRHSYHHHAVPKRIEKYLNCIISAQLYDVPEKMERFLWHAAQVRIIRSRPENGHQYHEQLISIVLERNGGRGIFPRLHTLKCYVNTLDQVYILSLSTSTLITLDITPAKSSYIAPSGELVEQSNATPENIVQVLEGSFRVSPNITSLALDVPLDENSTRTLLRFPRLRSLRQVQITSPAIFVTLLSEPRLVSLDLQCNASTYEPPSKQLPRSLRSEHLVELSIKGPCATLTLLFLTVHAPSLRRSCLALVDGGRSKDGVWKTADMAAYVACMRAFVAAVPALEELSLSLRGYWHLSLGELLAPILSLRAIRRFIYGRDINAARHTGTDADLAAVAQAWGRGLEVLRFEHRQYFWEKQGPVLSAIALADLRASCPRLVDLLLPPLDPNLEKLASVDTRGAGGHAHPLNTLSIRLWETKSKDITDDMRQRWEAYLIRLFPKLADGEGNEKLLVGELPDQPRRFVCRTGMRCERQVHQLVESESSDDELPAGDSTSRHLFVHSTHVISPS